MLLIVGSTRIKPETREKALAAGAAMAAASLAEPGCRQYGFWTSVDDPNQVLLFEEWESEEALQAHFATPHMADFGAVLGEVVDGPFEATKYEVASSGPLF
ncbi:MAG TPA: putative quinol monooxygenase [Acidimicrobiales bacterium]|nr:putative quinol monooxygenase [Acidimicrobiales bacterium]